MSLNGLDDPAIKEAHEAAVSEPGGWFLLNYASRDGIVLHSRGTGGIVDIRNSIAKYEEPSPLYGFLKYRRRNVIIKYLPETCSRLVQARAAVHFNAICERFTPYNTTFVIAAAKELKDTKLSAACSLHTASSSTSSSTSSLRRRRLMEIAEEEEEEQRATKRQSVVKEEEHMSTHDLSSSTSPPPPTLPVTLDSQLATAPNASKFASSTEPPPFLGASRPPSPSKSLDPRRLSSQLSPSEMYSYASYYGKPKVKLGPRPSLDIAGRPRTSAGTGNYRPVSSIPAGFKLFSKGSRKGRDYAGDGGKENSAPQNKEDKVTDSPQSATGVTGAIDHASIPIPAIPASANSSDSLNVVRPHTSEGRPTTSSGVSIKSVKSTAAAAAAAKQSAMTPEKARLMKAMKLRERKRKMDVQQPPSIPIVDIIEVPSNPTTADSESTHDQLDGVSLAKTSDTGSIDDRQAVSNSELSLTADFTESAASATSVASAGPADSAIDVGLSAADQVSVDSQISDSHPASPLAMSSEVGDSTKASSLSESTDETVQALHDLKADRTAEDEVAPGADIEDAALTPLQSSAVAESPRIEKTVEESGALPSLQEAGQEPGTVPGSGAAAAVAAGSTATASAVVVDVIEGSKDGVAQAVQLEGDSSGAYPVKDDAAPANLSSSAETPEVVVSPVADKASSTVATELRESQSTISLETEDVPALEVKRARRRAMIDPIRTDLNDSSDKENSHREANLSDDEEFLEELQSATVQEARPMTVSKSPINPVFPGSSPSKSQQVKASSSPTSRNVRTVSNPIRGPLLVPGDTTASTARSVSSGAAFLHKLTQQSPTLAPKKSNIGSSISQRIKALEKLSANTAAASDSASVRTVTERPASTFFSVRKASSKREPSRSPSIVDRTSSLTRDKTPSPPDSRESVTPEALRLTSRDRSGSMASRLSLFEGGNLPRGRPESIQVKARIIRDPTQPFPRMHEPHSDASDFNMLDLKQSPLVVDHQRATPTSHSGSTAAGQFAAITVEPAEPLSRRESIQERRMSKEKRRSQSQDRSTIVDGDDQEGTRPRRRSSLSIVRDFIKERRGSILGGRSPSTDNLNLNINNLASPASILTPSKSPSRPPSVHTTTGFSRRLSISSRRSSISKDRDLNTPPLSTPLSPSLMTETSGSGDETKSSPSPSELGHRKTGSAGKNRATRFMRRLSSSLNTSRKATTPTISPTVAEEDERFADTVPPSRASSAAVQQNVISYVGDVNVQFPDNLLWKRRTLCLDSQGFLIFTTVSGMAATTAGAMAEKAAGTVKRYHLSDFRMPYVPDMEVQELPNSVCLDLVEGSSLQIACEDRPGQLNVLQIIQEAHQSHTSFGQ